MTRMSHGGIPSRTILAALVVLLGGRTNAISREDAAHSFLASTFTVGAEEFERLGAGEVVTRTLSASDAREVATLGIVRMRITPDFYISQLVDIVNFKRTDGILQIGVFRTPAAVTDVAGLTLDTADIRSLRECRVGRCGVQLPADAITRFQRDVNWSADDAAPSANALMRQILVEYVARYQQAGRAAAMDYVDQAEPRSPHHEFASLAGPDVGGWDRFPGLRSHLLDYPDGETPVGDTRDLLYWSKERVGRRGVASVTHLSIARTDGVSPAEYAIASKQIYGTHYYDGSLGLTMLLRDRTSETPAMYVAYLNRSRIDIFTGVLGGLARRLVTVKARSTVSDQLERLKRTLEAQFAAVQTRR
jgi:hypothetical protein